MYEPYQPGTPGQSEGPGGPDPQKAGSLPVPPPPSGDGPSGWADEPDRPVAPPPGGGYPPQGNPYAPLGQQPGDHPYGAGGPPPQGGGYPPQGNPYAPPGQQPGDRPYGAGGPPPQGGGYPPPGQQPWSPYGTNTPPPQGGYPPFGGGYPPPGGPGGPYGNPYPPYNAPFDDELTAQDAAAFVGSNSQSYLAKWEKNRHNPNFKGWNWCGFLFGAGWMIYRKMYKEAIILFVFNFALGFGLSLMGAVTGINTTLLTTLINWAVILGVGYFANLLYYRKAVEAVRQVRHLSEWDRAGYLSRIGGTNTAAAAVYAVVMVVYYIIQIFM